MAQLIIHNKCGCTDTAWVTIMVSAFTAANIFCVGTVCAQDACPYPSYVEVPIIPPVVAIEGPIVVCPDDNPVYTIPVLPNSTYSWWITPSNSNITINQDFLYQTTLDIPINYAPDTFRLHIAYQNAFLSCEGSCGGTSSLLVKIKPKLEISGLPAHPICLTDMVQLTSAPASTWTLYNADGSILATFTPTGFMGNQISFSPITYQNNLGALPTNIVVTVANPLYCNIAEENIGVEALPPTPNFADDSLQCICPGNVYTYATLPAPGCHIEWGVIGGTLQNTTGYSAEVVFGPGPPPYQITLQNVQNTAPYCASLEDTITLEMCLPIPFTITGDTSVCVNDTLMYCIDAPNISNFQEFEWVLLDPLAGTILGSDTSSCVFIQWNNTPQTTALSLTAYTCNLSLSAILPITILGIPALTLQPNPICEDESITLTAVPVGGGTLTGSQFTWNMGDGSGWLPTGISTIQHTYYDAGNYSVFLTLEDVNFCSGTYLQDSFNLTVTPHPELEITSSNPPICDPNTGFITVNTTLTANLNNAALFATIAYSWSTGATTASISVTNVGTYTCWVTATTPNGASAWTNIASLPANTATYTDNNVSPSTIYYYKVAAFNNIGEEFSNTDSAKTLATAIPPPFKGSISLFPNPNKGSFRLNIETEIAQSATFTVYDMLGKIVYTQPLNLSSGTQSISMVLFQQIASGIYLAELSTSKGKWTEKMVVE